MKMEAENHKGPKENRPQDDLPGAQEQEVRETPAENEEEPLVVADMSAVESPWSHLRRRKPGADGKGAPASNVTRGDRRAYIGGALAATLLIGLVYAAAIGLAILIMCLLWR